jgi:hypothetical protein
MFDICSSISVRSLTLSYLRSFERLERRDVTIMDTHRLHSEPRLNSYAYRTRKGGKCHRSRTKQRRETCSETEKTVKAVKFIPKSDLPLNLHLQ